MHTVFNYAYICVYLVNVCVSAKCAHCTFYYILNLFNVKNEPNEIFCTTPYHFIEDVNLTEKEKEDEMRKPTNSRIIPLIVRMT